MFDSIEGDKMEVFEAIQARRSVRAYLKKKIPEKILNKVLEAARIAPSANNFQPWHFIVVKDAAKRKALSTGRWAKFLVESPVVIVGCGDKKKSPEWHVIDTTIALQNMVLEATSEGLGTCWIGSFHENDVKSLLKIPDNFNVVALLAVGYPKKKSDPGSKPLRKRNRRDMEKIVSFEEFGKK